MISEEQIDLLVERLVNRMEQANTYFLEGIGSYIKKIRNLSPSKAYQLIQMLQYGEDYNELVQKLSKLTNMNIQEIDSIFSNYAMKDQRFYERFYKYRNIPFIPYQYNELLQRQTLALASIVKNEMYDYTRANVLGYSINGKFYNLRETYNQLLDTALLNVGTGKESFDSAMSNIIKEIGGSGLKTLDYRSGRKVRLDSSLRTHLKSRLNELHNQNQKLFGMEFGADGYEISVHSNPAPDHADVQGRQFSIGQYELLQNGGIAEDYKGRHYTLDHDNKNGYRPISEMNCYHTIFPIILGVSEPEYSDKQLKQINEENNKKIKFEGKEYTKYQCTQLQRQLEREIRKQKDTQILAKASDNKNVISTAQQNITILTNKYRELSNASGLPTKMNRLRVSGYRRKKVK